MRPLLIAALVAYHAALLGIGVWASRRNRSGADFFLGGRGLGPWVGALAASAASSSAWTLLGVSGAAFQYGLGAVWLFPGCVGGFALNWFLVGPRLRRASRESGAVTLVEFLAQGQGPRAGRRFTVSAALVVLLSLAVYVAAQFQAVGKTFHAAFGLDFRLAVLLGGGVVLFYTMSGGFWAVTVTDLVQGLVMAAAAALVPICALAAAGGPGELLGRLRAVDPVLLDPFRGMAPAAALGMVLGLLGIGLGYPGQPHVVDKYMALRDAAALRRARVIAMAWAVVIYGGMLVTGWCGRVLAASLEDPETVLFRVTAQVFPAVMAGVVVAAVLSAIMSTVDSQLLVCSATLAHDLRGAHGGNVGVRGSRAAVLGIALAAIVAALYVRETLFNTVLFAWSALGAAFGPLLLVRLWRGPVRPGFALAALWSGFLLSVAWYFTDALKSRLYELLPAFSVALALAWLGARPPPR
ncbi:MAG: sodium/proline symporter [Planctomycetota bacterium]|nr:MAG: sodium/proline symporter [Planctomycetota bacterium]